MNRQEHNKKCIEILTYFVDKYPDMRMEQILQVLDGNEDRFYEESHVTRTRWLTEMHKCNKTENKQ